MKIGFSNNNKISNGSPFYQYLCTITGTLCIFASATHYGWPSPALPKLLDENSHITLTDAEGSWVAVMMLLGAPIGSIIAGFTLDTMGRKKAIIMTAFPFFASWIMIAYATSVEVLYIARFICGIADGVAYTAVPIYLGEIADPKIRGLLGSSCSVIMMIGILFVNIMGTYLSFFSLAIASSFVPILLLLTFSWMPETPYFLIIRGKVEESKKSLRTLRGTEDVDAEINRMVSAVKAQSLEDGNFLDLFTVKSNRKAILIMIGLRTVQQLAGITPITLYAKTVFLDAGNGISADLAIAVYFSVQCVVTIVSAMLLDKAGRRPLLIISTVGCAAALITVGTYYYINDQIDITSFNIIPIAALVIYIIAYCIGLGTIPVLMLGELFPTDVKAFALCIMDIYYSLIAAAASKFFQIMKDDFGMFIPFYVFAGCCITGLIFVFLSVPETKGKTLEDIQDHLKGKTAPDETDEA